MSPPSGPRRERLYSREQIAETVRGLAARIDADYEGRDLVLVCVLKGAFVFLADLARALRTPCEIEFVQIASYGAERTSSGTVELIQDVESPLRDRDVLVVEDIVDTGHSVRYLRDHFQRQAPRSLAFVALVDKRSSRLEGIELEYAGFVLDAGFVLGYGMDDGEKHRNLPEIYRVVEEG